MSCGNSAPSVINMRHTEYLLISLLTLSIGWPFRLWYGLDSSHGSPETFPQSLFCFFAWCQWFSLVLPLRFRSICSVTGTSCSLRQTFKTCWRKRKKRKAKLFFLPKSTTSPFTMYPFLMYRGKLFWKKWTSPSRIASYPQSWETPARANQQFWIWWQSIMIRIAEKLPSEDNLSEMSMRKMCWIASPWWIRTPSCLMIQFGKIYAMQNLPPPMKKLKRRAKKRTVTRLSAKWKKAMILLSVKMEICFPAVNGSGFLLPGPYWKTARFYFLMRQPPLWTLRMNSL